METGISSITEAPPIVEQRGISYEEHFIMDYDKTLVNPDNSVGTAQHILRMIYDSNRVDSKHPHNDFIRSEACIATSKTAAEMQHILLQIGFWGVAPFISENSEIHIPRSHANRVNPEYQKLLVESNDPYVVIKNGGDYITSMLVLNEILAREEITTLDNTLPEDFFSITALTSDEKERAAQRKSLGLFIPNRPLSEEELRELNRKASVYGHIIKNGGNIFYQISAVKGTKEAAVAEYKIIYSRDDKKLQTMIFGDAEADIEMLKLGDKGVLVGDPSRKSIYVPPGIIIEKAVGPMAVSQHVASTIKGRPQTQIH